MANFKIINFIDEYQFIPGYVYNVSSYDNYLKEEVGPVQTLIFLKIETSTGHLTTKFKFFNVKKQEFTFLSITSGWTKVIRKIC